MIRYSQYGKTPLVWPTVLFPYKSDSPNIEVTTIPVDAPWPKTNNLSRPVAIGVTLNDSMHVFFEQEQPGTQCRFDSFETDAKAALISVNAQDEINASCIINGSYLKYKGKEIDISSK